MSKEEILKEVQRIQRLYTSAKLRGNIHKVFELGKEYDGGVWTNGTWSIKWVDGQDEVAIIGPNNQKCFIAGGDLESLLSALCAVKEC